MAILFAVAIALDMLAPAEQTLGDYVKLVYVHAAITWVGLLLFAAMAFASGAELIGSGARASRWSHATLVAALTFWTGSIVLGLVNMQLIWGGILWAEPKFLMALMVFLLSLAVYQASANILRSRYVAFLRFALGVSVWTTLLFTGRLFHPGNAITRSDSAEIKIYVFLVTMAFLGIAIEQVRFVAKAKRSREATEVERRTVTEPGQVLE